MANNIKESFEIYSHLSNLVEKWSDRIDLVESVAQEALPYDKKIVLAQCLENTMDAIKMTEATDYRDVNGFKMFALDIVTAVIPNLVANDIVSIQPINHEVGVINYIRYLYGNTKGSAQAGQEFASGILYQGSDPYYSSEEIHGEGVVVTPTREAGEGVTANPGTIEGTLAWKPIIKGSIKLVVNFKNNSNPDNTIRAFIVDRKNISATTVEEANLGTLVVVNALDGKVIEGVLNTATETNATKPNSYVDYASGSIKAVFASGYTLLEDSSTLVDYRYDNRQVGDGAIGTNQLQVPEVSIRIDSMPVVCQSRKLKALYAFDAAYKLQKEYGTDINALLNSQIASEIAHEIDGELMNDLLFSAGLINEPWNETRPEGISLREHYDSFRKTIINGSNLIFGATKRAQANFLIAGLSVATVIETMSQFVSSGAKNVIGPHISGTIGNITVIKDPFYPTDSYVLGYKGTSLFDAGYYYCPYMPVTTTQLIMLDDFVGRKAWATSYAKKMVQPLLYCRGEITHLQYTNSGVPGASKI